MSPPVTMRLRITRQLYDRIDGIQFSSFQLGYVYDLGTTIANYLLAVGAAEPVDADEPTIVLPPDRHLFHPAGRPTAYGRSEPDHNAGSQRALAADRPPRPRNSKQRHSLADVHVRVAALAAEIERIKRQLQRVAPAI